MMRLVVILVLIGALVWYFFLRKSSVKQTKKPQEEVMVECSKCGTYISSKEAIVVGKKYFCSKKCLD